LTNISERIRRRLIIATALSAVAVTIFAVVISLSQRRLSAQERLLLGAWECRRPTGTVVFYFDDDRVTTSSSSPFTTFQFKKWRIDENQRIHFKDHATFDAMQFGRTIRHLFNPRTDTWTIQIADGTVTLTGSNGTEMILTPYTGDATETLKNAR